MLFLISILLVGVGFIVRLKLAETPHFKEVVERKEVLAQPVMEVLRRDWRSFLLAIGITVSEVGLAYLLTVFTVVYATTKLGLPRQVILDAVVYAAIVEFATLPLAGWLSDIFGRKALYLAGGVFSVALAFPLFWFLDTREPVLITPGARRHDDADARAAARAEGRFHAGAVPHPGALQRRLVGGQCRGSAQRRLLAADCDRAARGAGASWAVSVYIIALSIITIVATLMAPETARTRSILSAVIGTRGSAAPGTTRKVMVSGARRTAPAAVARPARSGSSSLAGQRAASCRSVAPSRLAAVFALQGVALGADAAASIAARCAV